MSSFPSAGDAHLAAWLRWYKDQVFIRDDRLLTLPWDTWVRSLALTNERDWTR